MANYKGYQKLNMTSYDTFRAQVNGNGYDVDGSYGAQCWDGASIHTWNATGGRRTLNTMGTGAAKGAFNTAKARSTNAGSEYDIILDVNSIKRGDMVFWGWGTFGHVGFADEDFAGKSSANILGQNQVGNGGGYPFTVKKLSIAPGSNGCLGAYRLKAWKTVTPAPNPDKPKDDNKNKVILPVGITLAALAAALGLTVPQLLGDHDVDCSLEENKNAIECVDPNQKLDDDQAKDAADKAKDAVEDIYHKTPLELAKERAGEGAEVKTIVKYNKYTGDGTIWGLCDEKYDGQEIVECVETTIENNKETIAITAAEHNLPGDGHWVFEGEQIVIK